MSIFIFVKIVHIVCAIFFIGVVGFRTFIIPVAKNSFDEKTYKQMDNLIARRARSIIMINNIFLILSGMYLFMSYMDTFNLMLHIKAFIGLVLAFAFYVVPIIMKKFNYIPWFNKAFHHSFFSLMILVVILSQIMFS